MRARTLILAGLGLVVGLAAGVSSGWTMGTVYERGIPRMEATGTGPAHGSPDGAQEVRSRVVSHSGHPRLPRIAWQAVVSDRSSGEVLVVEIPGSPGELEWRDGHVLVIHRGALDAEVEWSPPGG